MCRLIISLLLILLSGCGTTHNSKAHVLTDTLETYAATIRWGDWAQAQAMLDPETLKAHPVTSLDIERFHQYKVSFYHDGDPLVVKVGEVQVIAEIGLINVNTQQERNVIDHQTWHYDEKAKRWLLMSGLPDIAQH
jgi:hypothetical protein